jgi:RNA polymerase sigma factor (sigma-70 family)
MKSNSEQPFKPLQLMREPNNMQVSSASSKSESSPRLALPLPLRRSLSVAWPNREGVSPQTATQAEKLSNYDLILQCQLENCPGKVVFAELIRRYQSHVEKVLYHLAPDWSDRADLAQEVWIRVYRNIKRLQEPEKFRGWLSRIATNLFYDELRKRKRVSTPLSLDAPRNLDDGEMDWEIASEDPGPAENLVTREFYDQLREAIADLPEVFRTTIVLREIEGMAYEEIAELTGVSLGTVKSRIARARQRLQFQLQDYLEA